MTFWHRVPVPGNLRAVKPPDGSPARIWALYSPVQVVIRFRNRVPAALQHKKDTVTGFYRLLASTAYLGLYRWTAFNELGKLSALAIGNI